MKRYKSARLLHTLAMSLIAVTFTQEVLWAELGFAGPPCPAGKPGPRIVTLSAVMPGVCNDAVLLQNIIYDLGQTGTLIVDKSCVLSAGLRLPSRFTLKGTGLGSAGVLAFTHDGIALSACQEQPRGYISVSDIDLYGPYAKGLTAPHSTGIALANMNIVNVARVRVSDFHTGLSGVSSYSVFIEGSNISNNRGDNIKMGYDSNAWRIRDGLVSQAGGWGINVLGPGDAAPLGIINSSNDLLIDGVRMESNFRGAVRTNAYGTRIMNSRFEGNGLGSFGLPHRGILVDTHGEHARILTNMMSSDCIRIQNATAQRAFNIPAQVDVEQCQGLGLAP
jgi:hypothetical protein